MPCPYIGEPTFLAGSRRCCPAADAEVRYAGEDPSSICAGSSCSNILSRLFSVRTPSFLVLTPLERLHRQNRGLI